MAENTITTSVKELTFDDVMATFEDETITPPPAPSLLGNKEEEKVVLNKTAEEIKKEEEEEERKKKEAKPEVPPVAATPAAEIVVKDVDTVLDSVDDDDEDVDEPEDKKEEPSSLIGALQKLIEEDVLLPFDEEKALEEYSAEDLTELLKANIEHQRKEALESEVGEFFAALPKELQYAAKYVADGGTDMKGLFKALAATEEIKTVDTSTPSGMETVIREYYRAIDWGTDEEIAEEVEKLREAGEKEMEKIANKFKPKLEKMHEEVTKQHIQRQERASALAAQEMEQYLDNAHEAIKSGKLGTVQLDKKTQSSLWAGLTQPTHQTRRGATTNELGHLLEKYQYTEPNFALMYKVLWLLKDEKGFEENLKKSGKTEGASETARVLKTEQGKKTPTGTQKKKEDDATIRKTIKRNQPPSFMSGIKPK